MKLTPNTGDYRKHLEGKVYQSNIRRLEFGEGEYGDYILIRLDGGVEDGTAVMASLTLSKRSKLGRIVKALDPTYDYTSDYDTDMLIGEPVAVTFEHVEKDDGSWSEKCSIVGRGDNDPITPSDDEAPF